MFLSGCGFLSDFDWGSGGGGGGSSAVCFERGVVGVGSDGAVALVRRRQGESISTVFFCDCRLIVMSFL